MLGNFTYCNPTKLYFGKGAIKYLNDELPKYGKKVVLIYGGGSIKKNGIYDELKGLLTEAGKAESIEQARDMLKDSISSGAALKKLSLMVSAQHGDGADVYDTSRLPLAPVQYEVLSEEGGYVRRIEAESVGLVSMHLGGGRATKDSKIDLSVGLVLHKKVGDKVEPGESLATIHASGREKAEEAAELLRTCFSFSSQPVERGSFIKAIIR